MDTASFTGFLKTLAILILIYYGIRIAFRLLAPVLVQQVVKKAQQNFHDQQQQYQQQANPTASEKPREKKKVGEYIDFEEIE